jgi:gas vesicle protein
VSKLIALFAVALAAALTGVLFFWRRSEESWGAMWGSARESTTSWSKTAVHESAKAADRVSAVADDTSATVSDFADELTGSASQAAHEAGKATDSAAERADDATTAATNLADEVKGGNAT